MVDIEKLQSGKQPGIEPPSEKYPNEVCILNGAI
jgi:hypothetical protein